MSKIITLSHTGGVSFEIDRLIDHIRKSGRTYIIQSGRNCRRDIHPEPCSLDVWLRDNFAHNPNVKQATNEAIGKLVATGHFRQGKFECPDNTHNHNVLLKGIELVSQ